jgi:voltage-gated potassium channel
VTEEKHSVNFIEKIRIRIYQILERAAAGDRISRAFDIFIVSLICANVLVVIFETLPSLSSLKVFFRWFEIVSVVIFSLEYLLRVWSCTVDKRYGKLGPILGRLRFIVSFMGLVDLLAILPFYLPFVFLIDLRMIRLLRIVRMFRVFKAGRYSVALQTLGRVLKAKRAELIMTLSVTAILLVISGSLMYYVENPAQPEVFSSIPQALWWGVATLTTVGYGDVYPITAVGKLLGAVIAVLGVGLFALPAGILGSGFVEDMKKGQGASRKVKGIRELTDVYRVILPERFIGKSFKKVARELRAKGFLIVGMKRGNKTEINPRNWEVKPRDEVLVVSAKELDFTDL